MQSGWLAGIALQIRKDGQYYRNLGKPEAVFVEIKGANKTGFSCLFPHFCHKELIQMGRKKSKENGGSLGFNSKPTYLSASECWSLLLGKEKEYLTLGRKLESWILRVEYKRMWLCVIVKAWQHTGGSKLLLMKMEEEEEGGVNAVSVIPPTPNKQEQCTRQWAILACRNIAMAPQQAWENSILKM